MRALVAQDIEVKQIFRSNLKAYILAYQNTTHLSELNKKHAHFQCTSKQTEMRVYVVVVLKQSTENNFKVNCKLIDFNCIIRIRMVNWIGLHSLPCLNGLKQLPCFHSFEEQASPYLVALTRVHIFTWDGKIPSYSWAHLNSISNVSYFCFEAILKL